MAIINLKPNHQQRYRYLGVNCENKLLPGDLIYVTDLSGIVSQHIEKWHTVLSVTHHWSDCAIGSAKLLSMTGKFGQLFERAWPASPDTEYSHKIWVDPSEYYYSPNLRRHGPYLILIQEISREI